jgi:hypothetical protein
VDFGKLACHSLLLPSSSWSRSTSRSSGKYSSWWWYWTQSPMAQWQLQKYEQRSLAVALRRMDGVHCCPFPDCGHAWLTNAQVSWPQTTARASYALFMALPSLPRIHSVRLGGSRISRPGPSCCIPRGTARRGKGRSPQGMSLMSRLVLWLVPSAVARIAHQISCRSIVRGHVFASTALGII